MRRGRDSFIDVDQATQSDIIVDVGWLISVPEAVIDMCLVGGEGWFLDQEDVAFLCGRVVDECLHIPPAIS